MTTVLVTGSSGFIGLNVCRQLAEEGYKVYGIDVNRPPFEIPDTVELKLLDLTDAPDLPEGDVIVHLAAHSQVQPVVDNPSLAVENIQMTQHVLEQAEQMGAFVINTSSRDVYGDGITPAESDVTPDSPNGYAASKLGGEAIANAYSHTYDVPVTSLRLANVYGPMDTNQRVLPIFISLAANSQELTVYGEGKLLDFVYIDDVCDAIISSICRNEIVSGEAINIGSGSGTPLAEVAAYVAESIEFCPGWSLSPDRSGDIGQYVTDISKANGLLGFEPTVPLDQGLTQTINWYMDHNDVRETILSRISSTGEDN
jgi:UDP-glucose 4-epimerase